MNYSMKRIVPQKIERYCRENTTPESLVLRELVVETYKSAAFQEMRLGILKARSCGCLSAHKGKAGS
jgi:hypothetical protein